MTTSKQTKEKIMIYLPPELAAKARTLAAGMKISISHLFEGLIAGVQLVPGEKDEKQN